MKSNPIVAFLVVIAFLTSAAADAFEVVNLWPDTPPGDKAEQYQDSGGEWYTPRLEFWRPENQKTDACIIICCGGAYNGVAYEIEGVMPRDFFTENGIACALVSPSARRCKVRAMARRPARDSHRTFQRGGMGYRSERDRGHGLLGGGHSRSWPRPEHGKDA